jgi:prepilin-type N-terminal cleavage/methylation domain-containing protein
MSNNTEIQNFPSRSNESGFTLLEAVVAIAILTIGLVGTAAAVTYALQFSAISQNVTKSKLLLMASVEQIESLRNSRRLEYKQIANVGAVNNTDTVNTFSGFGTDFQPIFETPGADGVFGTADDSTSAGADGNYGTADDVPAQAMPQYMRQIIITQLSGSIKKVQVTVRYPGKGDTLGEITGVSYLNDDARMTR